MVLAPEPVLEALSIYAQAYLLTLALLMGIRHSAKS